MYVIQWLFIFSLYFEFITKVFGIVVLVLFCVIVINYLFWFSKNERLIFAIISIFSQRKIPSTIDYVNWYPGQRAITREYCYGNCGITGHNARACQEDNLASEYLALSMECCDWSCFDSKLRLIKRREKPRPPAGHRISSQSAKSINHFKPAWIDHQTQEEKLLFPLFRLWRRTVPQ
jgi:hypothetical protein